MGARTQDLDYCKMRVLLKQWRNDADLTIRSMGERLQKPYSYVHKVEVGDRRIDPLEFIDWCKACNVDPAKKFKELLKICVPAPVCPSPGRGSSS